MVKVIETNLSINDKAEIVDFQSRVIEVKDWESFVAEVRNGETISRKSCLGWFLFK